MGTVLPDQYGLVRPSAAQKLTPLDMNLPRVYGARWALYFSLSSGVNKVQILDDLKIGLAQTIVSIPWIAGNIGPEELSNPSENRVQIVDQSEGVLFRCKDVSHELPSYPEMKRQNFPLHHQSLAQIFPVGVMPTSSAPVFAAQANFVEGGLLLTVAIHHSAGDAVALQTILDTWSQNTTAAAEGSTKAFTTYDEQSNDRSVLMECNTPYDLANFPEYILSPTPKPDPSIPPPVFEMPLMETRLFRFSPARLAGLKSAAAAFSTNDALCAFLWCAMTRARMTSGTITTPESTSAFAYAVNIRSRASPPLVPNYLGNASMLGLTERLSMPTLAGAEGISRATTLIRQSLNLFQDHHRIPQVIGLMASRRDPTDYKMAYHAFLGPDVVATSWADVPIYCMSWGNTLGRAEAFRAPADGADGVITILPRCADGGLDVQVGLKSEAMAKLLADNEFMQVAEM